MSWKRVKFKDVASVLSGFAFSSELFNTDSVGLPIIRIRDVNRGYSETYYSGPYDEKYVVGKGEYLIGMDGEFNIAPWQSVPSLLNQRVCKLDEINEQLLDRKFLAYFLARELKEIEDATSYVTVKHLSVKVINEILIPLPPLAEQKRIAAILDQADALRAKRRAALARLDALVQSVFLEMFGDPVTNPMGWEVVKLAQTFSTKPQIGTAVPAHEGGEQIIIRVGELGDDYVALEKCKFVTLASKELKKFSVKAGDFLLARAIGSEDHLGKASLMQDTMMPVVYDSHVMRLRFDNKILLPQFFLIWMRTQGGRRRFMQRAGRTAVQFNINTKQISDIDLPLPPVSKQSQFVKFYDCIQIQQGRYTKALQIADKLFHSLQQRAFRGEL